MPSDKQGRAQRQGHRNGGSDWGTQETFQDVGQQLREGYESARTEMGRRWRQAERTMARNPASSILIGFGLGFGVGLVVTSLLGERRSETWAQRHLPDRLRNWPDALQDTLEQLGDSVRRLPGAIKSHLPG
jgi:hypothetical protein